MGMKLKKRYTQHEATYRALSTECEHMFGRVEADLRSYEQEHRWQHANVILTLQHANMKSYNRLMACKDAADLRSQIGSYPHIRFVSAHAPRMHEQSTALREP